MDDWPVFNEGKNIALLTRGRHSHATGPGKITGEASTWIADLSKPDLELGWYQKRRILCHRSPPLPFWICLDMLTASAQTRL